MRENAKLKIFISSGEASGDMLGAALAEAIAALDPSVSFGGIGNERMAAAGVVLSERTAGWGAMGPLEALRRVPVLALMTLRHLAWFVRSPWDLIVLIDFGAVHLRLAQWLRACGYRRPILYLMPPGAFLDIANQARKVASATAALTAFEHQRDFYGSLGLPIAYFGHPLVTLVQPRSEREPAPPAGGTVAFLPGSRSAELAHHLGPLLGAAALLRARRPGLRVTIGAADAEAERAIARALAASGLADVDVVRGARAALARADAAAIASGTAVLEAALLEVPVVALYVINPAQVPLARRIWKKPYITLPNIVLGRAIVPELLQDAATPQALAAALEALLDDPHAQLRELRALRERLGPADALERCARFALEKARS